jgi:hypothetical protein
MGGDFSTQAATSDGGFTMSDILYAIWRFRRALSAATLLCTCLSATAAELIAEVIAMRGGVEMFIAGEVRPVSVGLGIPVGCEIRTASQGRVKLRFVDGSIMVVSDASKIKVDKFMLQTGSRARRAEFTLDVGLISQVVAPSKGGRWTVRTPSTVTAVRGTEYIIEARPDGSATNVHVVSGTVMVEPNGRPRLRGAPATSGQEVLLLDPARPRASCDATGRCQAGQPLESSQLRALEERLSGF